MKRTMYNSRFGALPIILALLLMVALMCSSCNKYNTAYHCSVYDVPHNYK